MSSDKKPGFGDFLRAVHEGKVKPMENPSPPKVWELAASSVGGLFPIRVFRDGAELPVRSGMAAAWQTRKLEVTAFWDGSEQYIEARSREGWFTLDGPALLVKDISTTDFDAPGFGEPLVGVRVNVAVPSEGEQFAATVYHVDEDGWHFFRSEGAPSPWAADAPVEAPAPCSYLFGVIAEWEKVLNPVTQDTVMSDGPPSECPAGHDEKRKAGPCRDSYCACPCSACRADCAGEKK